MNDPSPGVERTIVPSTRCRAPLRRKTILAVSAPVAVGDEYPKSARRDAAVDAWRANVRPGGFARRSRPHHPESTARVCETRRPDNPPPNSGVSGHEARARARIIIPPLARHTPPRRAGRPAGEMFANLFPKRDRFTPANVRRLADALARTPAVTPANGDHLVETFREIAELMIYGDQNDPSFFDLFVELKVMSHISRFVKQSGSRPGSSKLTLQLLQTLSIMIQNTREETSLFYLFSNDHVPKELIEHDFDFDDEEVLAYYISFLKTVSLKLNPRTIQFFFFTGADNGTRRSRREPQHPDASAAAAAAAAAPPTTTTTRTRVFRCTSARRDFSPIPRAWFARRRARRS